MTIRSILACVSGGTASDGTVEIACRLARRFEAHLEGIHVKFDPRALLVYAGEGMGTPMVAAWYDQFEGEATAKAAKTQAAFAAAVSRHRLAWADTPSKATPSATWREEVGHAPSVISRRTRFFDVAILGRSERVVDQPHTDVIEETLVHSGRPVLIAPARAPEKLGDIIAIGWNGSVAAVRVLAMSLPLFAAARDVVVITVGNEPDKSAGSVAEYLRWHGVVARCRRIDSMAGVGAGEQLLASARDEGADLLIMGGYGHTPWREALFGGATREVVESSLLPLLLSH